jgi:molybdenum cofactor biosynthesis protein B
MSDVVAEHKAAARASIGVALLTVSDTRTLETDTSGATIVQLLAQAGHDLRLRRIVPDEPADIFEFLEEALADPAISAVLVTGGTGISPRDRTAETLEARFTRPIPGYGELFRWLSYQEIGPACILSRATGGMIGPVVVLLMPGSRAAVTLAMTRIILPELPHLVREATKSL